MPERDELRTGWSARLTRIAIAGLLFLIASGLLVTLAPFHAAVQWSVLVHTLLGLLLLIPILWYSWSHFVDYRHYDLSDVVLLGYLGLAALVLCLVSGLVVTWQGLFAIRMSPLWRNLHLYSTIALLVLALPHAILVFLRVRKKMTGHLARPVTVQSVAAAVVALAIAGGLGWLYAGPSYNNVFPEDYNFLYGEDRPFAPSLAVTETGGPLDPESLAGSETCGSAGCHSQILEEWKPSAHRYSAMDPLFQKVQSVMAEQNGPESTRYCGGCHDPISLFSGAKNVFAENLTGLHGYNEGISCLSCHGVARDRPPGQRQLRDDPAGGLSVAVADGTGAGKFFSDFLIRTYPDKHNELSKRMFKAPEYCAACHKQFIDQEVNRVGWVQLAEPVRQLEGQPLVHRGSTREDHRVPRVPHAAGRVDRSGARRLGRLQPHRRRRQAPQPPLHRRQHPGPGAARARGLGGAGPLTEEWLRGDLRDPGDRRQVARRAGRRAGARGTRVRRSPAASCRSGW